MRPSLMLCTALVAAAVPSLAAPPDLKALLERQTQELLDAVAKGDVKTWDRYLAPDMVYAAEDGTLKSKADLLKEVEPLPPGITGELKVTDFVVRPHGDTAIATYTSHETEGFFGQTLHARYLETDTWQRSATGWRLIASQVLALRDDPPSVTLPAAALDDYVGTYSLTPEITYTIARDGDHLTGTRNGRKPESLLPEVSDYFFVPGRPRLRKVFARDAAGHVTGFVERRETWDVRWARKAS